MNIAASRKLINFISIIGLVISIGLTIYFINLGVFKDLNSLRGLVGDSIILGPIIFILIRILQVLIPIIPGGISTAAGVLIFGPYAGFIYNYVGLTLGSIIAYMLSRNFGLPLIRKLFKEETINKYLKYIRTKKFEKIFFWGIFLPGAPDDLLCYIAGISNLTFKKFVIIILIGKPLTLIFYSLFVKLF